MVRFVSNRWLLSEARGFAKKGHWQKADAMMTRLINNVVKEPPPNGQAIKKQKAEGKNDR